MMRPTIILLKQEDMVLIATMATLDRQICLCPGLMLRVELFLISKTYAYGEAKAPAPILEVEVPAEMLKRREGSFFCEELGMTALVELEGSRLYLSLKNSDDSMQPQLYMMPQDEKLFFLRDIASLKYVTSENNQEQIELVQSGRKFIFKRM